MEKLEIKHGFKYFCVPRNNHWLKRICLVFAFIIFDYSVTLIFCETPYQEANLYARSFMQSFGIPLGLTLFVLVANLPIYMTLSLDSHIVEFPHRISRVTETFVDVVFAWYVAGLHFSGGTSWFWFAPELLRQSLGMIIYLIIAFSLVKPHIRHYSS